jgi:hypothetical protein
MPMKKAIKIVSGVLAVALLLTAAYLLLPGFEKAGNVYISDYTVSDDGGTMTIKVGIATSMGYIRDMQVHQQHGGKLYLDFYYAFGGLNGDWGAKSEFVVSLNADTKSIAVYRNADCYQTILQKDENGRWQRLEAKP